tara:strand:+ start:33196 stop:33429 length:234 start_codon:yes stop_codon:yes gene_type:complete
MTECTDFYKCVDMTTDRFGIFNISCKLDLWGVSGKDASDIHNEAIYYWMQYKEDGEYSNILGGESVIDKLVNKKRGE